MSQYDSDDVNIKGDDGSEFGAKFTASSIGSLRALLSDLAQPGTTTFYTSTVGTTPIDLPTTGTTEIREIFVHCPFQTPVTNKLLYSVDGGTVYLSLDVGEFLIWPIRGTLTQLKIKGSVAGVTYEVILNRDLV